MGDELELRRIAETDHLTGALSRRAFVNELEKEIARYGRGNRGSVLILADIDHFKAVNDEYGHPAGDAVLRTISQVCASELRSTDSFGRLGGEEFGILLTETCADGGLVAAEKIRKQIGAVTFPELGGMRVTASFGLSASLPSFVGAAAWMAHADEALYRSKRSGRNRCLLAEQRQGKVAA